MKKFSLILYTVILSAYCSAQTTTLTLDLSRKRQPYDGVGAVFSYEKLFYDYPEKQRAEILDYLFKPKSGAALQIVKVEIGYDGNNTAMSWPSHQRFLDEKPDFSRGFGWWLMAEAKKRNPKIRLSGLHWGYPAFAQTDELKADFIFKWVEGASKAHNLNIDYIGGNQNESVLEPGVTKLLRRKLDNSGFRKVKIIAADEGARVTKFQVMDLVKNDPEYAKAVDAIGVHYKSRPAEFMPPGYLNTGKPLWSSEDVGGTFKAPDGYSFFKQWFKLFVELPFSASAGWLATASAYENMPWPNAGVIKAREPWSGYYKVGNALWAYAHLNQFTQPGWNFLESPRYLIPDTKAGQIIPLANSVGDFTVLFGTADPGFPERGVDVILQIKSFKNTALKIRKTIIGDVDSIFTTQPNVKMKDGKALVHLDKNCLYTVSTLEGGKFSIPETPMATAWVLPFVDNFESYNDGDLARFFVDANGAFEITQAKGRKGKALRQSVSESPVQWHYKSRPLTQPLTEFGDMNWKDYTVKADFLFEEPGSIYLSGRFDGKTESSGDYFLEGYWLAINDNGKWRLMRKESPNKENNKGPFIELASGTITKIGLNAWFTAEISFKGDQISVKINNQEVCRVSDEFYKNGNIAIGSVNPESDGFFTKSQRYTRFQIDNFEVIK